MNPYSQSLVRLQEMLPSADSCLKLLNLWLIYWIFSKNFTERKSERVRDAARESRKFMIQEVVLKPNLEEIAKFFHSCADRMRQIGPTVAGMGLHTEVMDELRKSIQDFKAELDVIKLRVVHPLGSLSEHFQSLKETVIKIEDTVTEYLEQVATPAGCSQLQHAEARLEEHRSEFVRLLLEGQRAFLSEDEKPPTKNKWFSKK